MSHAASTGRLPPGLRGAPRTLRRAWSEGRLPPAHCCHAAVVADAPPGASLWLEVMLGDVLDHLAATVTGAHAVSDAPFEQFAATLWQQTPAEARAALGRAGHLLAHPTWPTDARPTRAARAAAVVSLAERVHALFGPTLDATTRLFYARHVLERGLLWAPRGSATASRALRFLQCTAPHLREADRAQLLVPPHLQHGLLLHARAFRHPTRTLSTN